MWQEIYVCCVKLTARFVRGFITARLTRYRSCEQTVLNPYYYGSRAFSMSRANGR